MATIVLLHGLGRTSRSMWPFARGARARGHRVVSVDYRSRHAEIAAHAEALARQLEGQGDGEPFSFITHSLGGIVLRHAVAHGALDPSRVRRAVMIAPPNRGSEIADLWWDHPWLRRLGRRVMGPSLGELRTVETSTTLQLPPVCFDCGVIAGNRSLTRLSSRLIEGPNDGKVGVRRAGVHGMREMIEVPASHTLILFSPTVVARSFHFLQHGSFTAG